MEPTEPNDLEQQLEPIFLKHPDLFKLFQDTCFDGVLISSIEKNNQLWINDWFWTNLGYETEQNSDPISHLHKVIHKDDLQTLLHNIEIHCNNPSIPFETTTRYSHKDGSTVWVKCRGISIAGDNRNANKVLVTQTDITQLKQAEALLIKQKLQLEKLVRYDELTSLYNSVALQEIFSQHLLIAAREHMPISLAMVDVDNFKQINEQLGRLEGNKVLMQITATLKDVARDSDIIGRFDGDKFIVLMFNTNHKQAELASNRLKIGVQESITLPSNKVTVCVGVATFGEKSIAGIDLTPEEIYHQMLQTVNIALTRAKNTGKNQVCD
ncbi:sensor domain-containing diguanylate cyclase [Vibrio sp. TH_r3]|uniref:sensor domain-containing diguanylate cyclase n=1 Tax=Vibrio sp. TH_r3 TaxID=3082084 RepID=UPI00295423A6|nr:sensor domain-containing diguanylate cyclase [Vibrio sp. TH_r3]MDV7106076.1 sensor domain-containing diguanylate cyclase [Vibrio sp. TH_r3]